MHNLHISHDEKFIDYIIDISRELGFVEDRFVILSSTPQLRFVRNKNVEVLDYQDSEFWNQLGDVARYKNIFIHFLKFEKIDLVNKLPSTANVIWCFFGGDAFSLAPFQKHLYEKRTQEYLDAKKGTSSEGFNWNWLIRPHRVFLNYYFDKKYNWEKKREVEEVKAMRRVNYFAHFNPLDYQLVKQKLKITAPLVPFFFASIEEMIIGADLSPRVRHNVLLGNSDTATNNHLDVLYKLKEAHWDTRKVICPLSYEKKEYGHDMAKAGQELLGDHFLPLIDFMSKEEYNSLISTVAIAIMYHVRFQAGANILVCLWSGVKVYMNNKSTFYRYLKDKGVPVHSFQDDFDPSKEASFEALTSMETETARRKISELFGKEHQKEVLYKLLAS